MAKLRLTSPSVVKEARPSGELLEVDIAVDTPVPHLDGEYTYLARRGSLTLGSLVKVPFGAGETFGFVTRIGSDGKANRSLKIVSKVLIAEQLFDDLALARYRKMVEQYGGSLIAILKLAIPMRRQLRASHNQSIDQEKLFHPSEPDQKFLMRHFGFWEMGQGKNLLLAPGNLWDQFAVSIFLSDPRRTAIMVPTERDLKWLEKSLRDRGVNRFHVFSSGLRASERSREFFGLLKSEYALTIGTRSIAYAPSSFERVIIIDPGHFAYQEPRSPYLRADDPLIWNSKIITLSHSRELSAIASGVEYHQALRQGKHEFHSTSSTKLLADLQRIITSNTGMKSILVSLNDRSFASGLYCGQCKNRSSCECGFPLSFPERGSSPSCSKCGKVYDDYKCRYCSDRKLQAIRAGNKSWALSIAKSMKNAQVILSDSMNERTEVVLGSLGLTIVIATQGFEPRIYDQQNKYLGYDVVVLMGGSAGFNSSSLSKADQYRRSWARALGLVNAKRSHILIDLDPLNVEFIEFNKKRKSPGIEHLLHERRTLFLPPYALLVQVLGEENSLVKLRSALQRDQLFEKLGAVIYPVRNNGFIIKVPTDDRDELLRLLQHLVKVRSAKRLSPIRFHVAPEYL